MTSGAARLALAPALALATALLGAGCQREVALPEALDGAQVSAMAEHELERQDPRLAPGRLTCPDLRLEVGASVECRRTADLSGGRVVTVHGTVAVTSLSSGGRLHVAMEDDVASFGVSGSHLAADVGRQYAARSRARPDAVDCPFLPGRVGARVVCHVDAGGTPARVGVVVTAVDASQYRTTYVARVRGPS